MRGVGGSCEESARFNPLPENTYKTSPTSAPSSIPRRSCGVKPYWTRRYRRTASVLLMSARRAGHLNGVCTQRTRTGHVENAGPGDVPITRSAAGHDLVGSTFEDIQENRMEGFSLRYFSFLPLEKKNEVSVSNSP